METLAFYTIPQVAAMLRVSEAYLYALARRGDLPVVRIGRLVRVRHSALEAWLKEASKQ